jgi:glutamate racemase
MPTVRPVGIFDSGVGGLTVAGALLRRNPCLPLLYVADQAHVPYGGRPLEEIRGFATAISAFLAQQQCRAILMACNISSATALASVSQSLSPLPVYGMIAPAVRVALQPFSLSEYRDAPRIGVLATAGTVQSGAYAAALRSLHRRCQVTQVPCPKFVPLVEAGEIESAAAREAACEYLTPLAQARCQSIILGCTHYPYLLPTLQRVAADLFAYPVAFIDPAEALADALALQTPFDDRPSRPCLLLTTGDPDHFRRQIPRFLPNAVCEVRAARWQTDGSLQIA